MSAATYCAWCGRNPAAGWAFINDLRYCHEEPGVTCYMKAAGANASRLQRERSLGPDVVTP